LGLPVATTPAITLFLPSLAQRSSFLSRLKPLAKTFLKTLAVGKGENQALDKPNKKEFLKRDVIFSAEKNLVPGGSQTVKGFEMEDVKMSGFSSAPCHGFIFCVFSSFYSSSTWAGEGQNKESKNLW
jgi:hypothetical protein